MIKYQVLYIIVDPCAGMKSSDIDPECMISVADVFCCCLPLRARQCLRCGVRQKDKVGLTDTSRKNIIRPQRSIVVNIIQHIKRES